MIGLLLRLCLKFHNCLYALIGRLAVRAEGGLHPKHRLTDYHRWFAEKVEPDWKILDVGCGNGALASDLKKCCLAVTAIDISAANIEQAKKYKGIKFICGDATRYDFGDSYDAVILSNVLEHIEDRIGFLKKLTKVSDVFLIRVPLVDRDWLTLYKRELGIEYRLDPTHCIEYTLEELETELLIAGLSLDYFRVKYGEANIVARKGKQ